MRAAGIACEVVPGVSAALAAAADTQRPLTRRGSGRSVAFATAMSREGAVVPARSADTEVFYMGGKQLAALGRRLRAAGWPPATPVSVVSRAGWPDQLHTDHTIESLAQATSLHAGRPTVITVGAGAAAIDDGRRAARPRPLRGRCPARRDPRVEALKSPVAGRADTAARPTTRAIS